MTKKARAPLAVLVPALLASAIVLIPVWYLVDQVARSGWSAFIDEIWRQRTFELMLRSAVLTATVTLGSIVIGFSAAWLTTMTFVRGRTVLLVALSLPLAIPSYLSAFAWVSWIPDVQGYVGASIVLTLACYPYVMLPVSAALRGIDPAQAEVARSLGLSPREIVFRLTLRSVRPALASGALLVALYVMGDFGAVAVMRHEVFTWVIYGAYRAGFNPARAASLSVVLIAVALILTIAESKARGRATEARVGIGVRRTPRGESSMRVVVTTWAFSLVVFSAGVMVPLMSVLSWLGRSSGVGIKWSLVAESVVSSFQIGIISSFFAVLLALPIGIGIVRFPSRITRTIDRSAYIAHALPGIVVAISVVYVGIRLLRPVYQELPLLVLAQVVLFLPLAVATIRNSLEQSSSRLEDVSRSLGLGQIATIFRVTIPIALPGIAAGAALTMLAVVKELPTTLLLRPVGVETLATSIWKYSTVSDYAALGPYAFALIVLAAVPTAVLTAVTLLRGAR
jgi:iron(III) transport system permease protein